MNRCSISLVVREMQLTSDPLECLNLKKEKGGNKYWQECGETGILIDCWRDYNMVPLLCKKHLTVPHR